MNLFIEGIQGTGKSTLTNLLAQSLSDYTAYREGDYSPVELAWCTYMDEAAFGEMLRRYDSMQDEIMKNTHAEDGKRIVTYTRILTENPEFYKDMENYEIYNGRIPYDEFRRIIFGRYQAYKGDNGIFECSFFQNALETMMLFYEMSDEVILQFYREAFDVLKDRNFRLIYLDDTAVRENTLHIKEERCDENGAEMWFPLMMEYLKKSPYGVSHHYKDVDDMILHFERRRELELRIIKEVLGDSAVILPAKRYDFEKVKNTFFLF